MIADAGVVFAEAADCTGISHNGLVPSVFSKDSCELICGAASKPHSLFRMSWRAHNQRNCQQKYKSIDTESNPGHTAGFVRFLHIRWELEVIRTAGSFAGSLVDCSGVYRFRLFLCRGFCGGSAGRRAAAAAAKGAVRRLALIGISIGYLEIGGWFLRAARHDRHISARTAACAHGAHSGDAQRAGVN